MSDALLLCQFHDNVIGHELWLDPGLAQTCPNGSATEILGSLCSGRGGRVKGGSIMIPSNKISNNE